MLADDSKQLPVIEPLLMAFIRENVRNGLFVMRKSHFRKAFILFRLIEDLLYVTMRA